MELIGETRVCTVCGKEKDLSLFRKIRKKPDGTYYYKHICSSCAGKRYYYKHKICANCHRKVHAGKIELEVC